MKKQEDQKPSARPVMRKKGQKEKEIESEKGEKRQLQQERVKETEINERENLKEKDSKIDGWRFQGRRRSKGERERWGEP